MSAISGFLSDAVEKLLFRPVTVTQSELVANCFRLVRVRGEGLAGVRWIPGQAVQIYLGNLTKRAYTPMELDPDAGSARFLFYLHGSGPGSRWATNLEADDICKVMRPKDSLDFTTLKRPTLFFGDETSLALAHALCGTSRDTLNDRIFLEVSSPAEVEIASSRLGLRQVTLFERRPEEAHLGEIAASMAASASGLTSPHWVFTGQARSIQKLQKQLRALGCDISGSKVRAYWSPGKTGMD